MPNTAKAPWIEAGYALFAKEGPQGLKVEVISRQVEKSKSSFYHFFADLDIFTEHLLNHHLLRAKEIAVRESACANIHPELIQLLVEVKQDLLFNRQLRVNRHIPAFKTCFEQSNQFVGSALLELWSRDLGLSGQPAVAGSLLQLVMENFYLQITEENLNRDWLAGYFRNIHQMVRGFKNG